MAPTDDSSHGASDADRTRCAWAIGSPSMLEYHDREWGVPIHEDRHLFELLILEGAQAGLSWATILKKREGYRSVFRQFDPSVVADFSDDDIDVLMESPVIVRNRAKIQSAVTNARAFVATAQEYDSFDRYIWGFVEGKTIQNAWTSSEAPPAQTDISQAMSMDLRRRGFKFVGPTICYAFMQSAGLVNDHTVTCYRYPELLPW